jgi:hypothetical protein
VGPSRNRCPQRRVRIDAWRSSSRLSLSLIRVRDGCTISRRCGKAADRTPFGGTVGLGWRGCGLRSSSYRRISRTFCNYTSCIRLDSDADRGQSACSHIQTAAEAQHLLQGWRLFFSRASLERQGDESRGRETTRWRGSARKSRLADMNKKSNLSLMGIYVSSLHYKHPVSEAKAATQSVLSLPEINNKKENTTICTLCTTPFVIPHFFHRDLISKKRQERHAKSAQDRPC